MKEVVMQPISRRAFSASVATGIVGASTAVAKTAAEAPVGPMVGHVSTSQAMLWYRPSEVGSYGLTVRDTSGALVTPASTLRALCTIGC